MTKHYSPPLLAAIPETLRSIDQWVVWNATKKPGGRKGSKDWDAPENWFTFAEASARYLKGSVGDLRGVGFVLAGTHDLVGVDLDKCVDEDVLDGTLTVKPWALETVSELPGYWEISPSGTGLRGFFRAPGVAIPTGSKKVGSREIYTTGRYLTVTGRAYGAAADIGADDMAGPIQQWLDKWMAGGPARSAPTRAVAKVATGDPDLDAFKALADDKRPLADWGAERIRSELFPHLVGMDLEQGDWIRQGMILHHQFGGSEEGRELWRELSSQQPGYDVVGKDGTADEVIDARWSGFDSSGARAATLRALLYEQKDKLAAADRERSAVLVQSLVDEVMATANEDALEALCQDRRVAIGALAALDTVKLRNKVRAQLKSFPSLVGTSSRDLDALVKRFMAPPLPTVRAQQAMPAAFSGWVYVTQGDKFYNVHTRGDAITRMGFNALMNREVPSAVPPAVIRPAADMCTDLWGMKVVDRITYAPPFGDLFTMNGVEYANTYNPSSTPEVPEQYSEADLRAIEAVKRHLELMFPDPREARILLGWLAHNVQFPGRIIGWAPFIPGEKGIGKTFFSRLLRAVMGVQNVSEVNVGSISTQFKGWAAGAAVNVLEEVKLHGAHRYDILNGLKPYLTNLEIPMERKGQDPCTVPNFTNYLLLSNYGNGIPIDDGERRYCCLTSALTKADGERLKAEGHYDRLFDYGTDSQAGGLRKWLMEVTIDPEVLTKNAPMTTGRAETIAMGEPEAVEIGRHIIEDGALGVGKVALSSAHFTKALRERGVLISTSSVRDTLETLGYRRKVGRSGAPDFKWKGFCVTVYTKNPKLSPDEIRQALDEARPPSGLDEDVL